MHVIHGNIKALETGGKFAMCMRLSADSSKRNTLYISLQRENLLEQRVDLQIKFSRFKTQESLRQWIISPHISPIRNVIISGYAHVHCRFLSCYKAMMRIVLFLRNCYIRDFNLRKNTNNIILIIMR